GKELKIENLYTTDRYKEWITRMRKWNQAGYISPEAVTISLNERDGMGTGNVLGYFNNYKPGMENELSRNCGQEVARAPIAEGLSGLMTSQSINNVSWAISRNTASKEHAMQLLNLMYTDATLVNMLCYGLENEHYVFTDDTKKVIDYPAGVTAAAKKVDNGTGWQWGNQLLAYIWKGDSPTLWDDVSKYNAAAPRSAALGFVFDNAKVQNEITACTNVLAKYGPGLERGAVNPDEVLPEFQAALKSAGIETIMAEKQAQLDKWAKTKK
ncbi:MAG: ABC transporter substrate-binding protein, partial [Angelakisella sp.]